MITKQLFIDSIEAIRLQMLKDIANANLISQVFEGSDVNGYNNSPLIKTILSLLQLHFPVVDGHCAISFYCFELNFGKVNEEDLVTIEDLWDELTKTNSC